MRAGVILIAAAFGHISQVDRTRVDILARSNEPDGKVGETAEIVGKGKP